jgi:hypothetical protein
MVGCGEGAGVAWREELQRNVYILETNECILRAVREASSRMLPVKFTGG